jgi:hypothetical protein
MTMTRDRDRHKLLRLVYLDIIGCQGWLVPQEFASSVSPDFGPSRRRGGRASKITSEHYPLHCALLKAASLAQGSGRKVGPTFHESACGEASFEDYCSGAVQRTDKYRCSHFAPASRFLKVSRSFSELLPLLLQHSRDSFPGPPLLLYTSYHSTLCIEVLWMGLPGTAQGGPSLRSSWLLVLPLSTGLTALCVPICVESNPLAGRTPNLKSSLPCLAFSHDRSHSPYIFEIPNIVWELMRAKLPNTGLGTHESAKVPNTCLGTHESEGPKHWFGNS